MKPLHSWSIRTRLLLWVGAVSVISVVLLAGYILHEVINYRVKAAEQDLRYETTIILITLRSRIRSVEKTMEAVGRALESFEGSRSDLLTYMKHLIETHPEMTGGSLLASNAWRKAKALKPCSNTPSSIPAKGCYYADSFYEQRNQLTYIDLTTLEPDYTQQSGYRLLEALDKKGWVGPYHSAFRDRYLFSFAVPIETQWQEKPLVEAYVVGDVELDKAFDKAFEFNSVLLQQAGLWVGLMDNNNQVVIDSAGRQMQPFTCLIEGCDEKKAWAHYLNASHEDAAKLKRLPCVNSEDHQCLVWSAPLLKSSPLKLVVAYSLRDTQAGIDRFILNFVLICLLFLGLLIWVIRHLCNRITSPLSKLTDMSEEIGQGQFNQIMPKVKHDDEVGSLVKAFAKMQSALQGHTQKLEEETAKTNRFLGEMHAASIIQQAMLKGKGQSFFTHGQFSLWAKVKPAEAVGGDFYHYSLRGENRLAFILGDVSDKGISAAIFMARALSVFQSQIKTDTPLETILLSINQDLLKHNDLCMFVTLLCGELDLHTGDLLWISAGHELPIYVSNGLAYQLEGHHSSALGLTEDLGFIKNHLTLREGERFVMFSDGLSEALSESGEAFGVERLVQALVKKEGCPVSDVGEFTFSKVALFTGSQQPFDDKALMVFGLNLPYRFLLQPESDNCDFYHVSYTADGGAVDGALNDIDRLVGATSNAQLLGDVKLVAEEILSNAVKYGQIPFNEKIHLYSCLDKAFVFVEIVYRGVAFDPLAAQGESGDVALLGKGGLGLTFIRELSAQQAYDYDEGKNRLCLAFPLQAAE